MYSIVLATMLTTGSAAPNHFFHGCHGCCGGCYGNAFSYGCCGGCWGCYGCCGGCWGGCYGCCGGCYGCYGGYYAPVYYGCGCCGGGGVGEPAPVKKKMEKLPPPDAEENGEEDSSARSGSVIITAPLDAQVRFNGQPTRRLSTEQRFVTPALLPGRTYSYEIVAEAVRDGQTVTKTEKVKIRAGKTVRVDLNPMIAVAEARKARVTVVLPADAKLYIDGVACPLASNRRTFETPKLQGGRTYSYTLKAEVVRDGETLTDSRRVSFRSGDEVLVEFKNLPAPEQAARR